MDNRGHLASNLPRDAHQTRKVTKYSTGGHGVLALSLYRSDPQVFARCGLRGSARSRRPPLSHTTSIFLRGLVWYVDVSGVASAVERRIRVVAHSSREQPPLLEPVVGRALV